MITKFRRIGSAAGARRGARLRPVAEAGAALDRRCFDGGAVDRTTRRPVRRLALTPAGTQLTMGQTATVGVEHGGRRGVVAVTVLGIKAGGRRIRLRSAWPTATRST